MALYLIGLGLFDEKDITLRGLEAVRKCSKVYLESYTSRLSCSIADLERLYSFGGQDVEVLPADRELVEQKAEIALIEPAKTSDVALLVIGDPLSATTHTDIMLRAQDAGVKVYVINNASVLTAVGVTGLELYKFGKTTSIPFENENVRAPLDVYEKNRSIGLHTLFLLDLRPQENHYMVIKEALEYLLRNGLPKETMCVGCAGLGSENAQIRWGMAGELKRQAFDLLPQCLIIPGNLHFIEEESLDRFSFK